MNLLSTKFEHIDNHDKQNFKDSMKIYLECDFSLYITLYPSDYYFDMDYFDLKSNNI